MLNMRQKKIKFSRFSKAQNFCCCYERFWKMEKKTFCTMNDDEMCMKDE